MTKVKTKGPVQYVVAGSNWFGRAATITEARRIAEKARPKWLTSRERVWRVTGEVYIEEGGRCTGENGGTAIEIPDAEAQKIQDQEFLNHLFSSAL